MDLTLPSSLVEQWELLAEHVERLSDLELATPSARPGLTVGDLVGRAARSALALYTALASEPAPPASGQSRPQAMVRAAVSAATADLAALRLDQPDAPDQLVSRGVLTPGGRVDLIPFLTDAVAEAVLHGLDLGVPPVRSALRVTVRLFTASLTERAPGRSVELRVPPFAAVQIVEGPRHTRGTPPNVVEAEPVAFVMVATGRLDWETAVADGRVRASGERADLRSLLPLPSWR
ncbi:MULTISPECIES: sterol carrier family protein [Parafrankia]|uniref:sterol carrier family protein n=1 Tax=Parafrankia TaxID=2994362 RepID=UPI0013F4C908|nr:MULTISPECIES: sterol carrier family protein [Parafrankia]MBE3204222.1 maleylpyruvate isomerase N-terminal domain-containing protein [Parafrankia sp. CH37]